jgi:hypothetical protein
MKQAEELQNQLYLLNSTRGASFAATLGLTVYQAKALVQLELSKLLSI